MYLNFSVIVFQIILSSRYGTQRVEYRHDELIDKTIYYKENKNITSVNPQ